MTPIEVLMVEDDRGDVDLTREALRDAKVLLHLNVVEDGEEALAYLRRDGPHAEAVRPDLILLDLNLPRMDGREVLRRVKQDPDFRTIPVVILTTSAAHEDVLRTYDLGGNCYLTKPVGFGGFADVIRRIESFWFTVVRLPPRVLS